jgi:hypothetical protein
MIEFKRVRAGLYVAPVGARELVLRKSRFGCTMNIRDIGTPGEGIPLGHVGDTLTDGKKAAARLVRDLASLSA